MKHMAIVENIKKTKLSNGIRVLTEKIPYVRSVSIGVWVLAGTRDENLQNNGIAHFLEHMVFKGTKTRTSLELADSLESLGGQINAYTSKEHTCYYAHLLDEDLDIAIEILADMMLNSKLSTGDIQIEKDIVLEEITELEDDPGELVHEFFLQSLFQPHPMSYSILGSKETVKEIIQEDLIDFHISNYTANRIIISAAGNVDHDQVLNLVNKYFCNIPKLSNRKNTALSAENPSQSIYENKFQQAHICLGKRIFNYADERRYALMVLNTILGAGMSSRLFQNIREKHGLAYSIYSFVDFFQEAGIFGVYLGTDKEKIDLTLDLVKKELQKLIDEPIPKDELFKRKNQLKGNLILGMESTSNRMDRLAKMEIYHGKFIPLEETIKAIETVDQDQLIELAFELFQESKLFYTIFKPTGSHPSLTMKAG